MHLTDEQFNEYLDNETTERAQIEEHLSSCKECAARLSTLQALFAELDSLPELELTRDLAAPYSIRRNMPAQLPRWLPLTVTLQAAIAIVAFVVAAPFVIQILPAIEIPSLGNVFIQLQTQWVSWLDVLSLFQAPAIPTFSFEISSIYLISALGLASMLWLVGNGLLLRNQIK